MTEPYSFPCKTQFTVREFEEYIFHREKIRVVVRTLLNADTLMYPETMVSTSYFEVRFRNSEYRPQNNTMLLLSFVYELFKTTDIQEISIIFGDGSSSDYTRSDGEDHRISVKHHGDLPTSLRKVRSSYKQNILTAS